MLRYKKTEYPIRKTDPRFIKYWSFWRKHMPVYVFFHLFLYSIALTVPGYFVWNSFEGVLLGGGEVVFSIVFFMLVFSPLAYHRYLDNEDRYNEILRRKKERILVAD